MHLRPRINDYLDTETRNQKLGLRSICQGYTTASAWFSLAVSAVKQANCGYRSYAATMSHNSNPSQKFVFFSLKEVFLHQTRH